MACLIDTGVLLRAFDVSFTEYRVIRQSLRMLLSRQERMVTTLQNLAEFWNVSTRPVDRNGYGLSIERAGRRLGVIEQFCDIVTEDDDSCRIWKRLLETHSVTGVSVHDARLVSVMLSRGILNILRTCSRSR